MSKIVAKRIALGAIMLCVAVSGLVSFFLPEAAYAVALAFTAVGVVSLIAYTAIGDAVAGGACFTALASASIACAFGAASGALAAFATAVGVLITMATIMFANEMIGDR